jgi:hypothetical protein
LTLDGGFDELVRIPSSQWVNGVVDVVWSKFDERWKKKGSEEGGGTVVVRPVD